MTIENDAILDDPPDVIVISCLGHEAETLDLWEQLGRRLHAMDRDNWRSVVSAFEDISAVTGASNIPVVLAIFLLPRPEYWDDYPHQDLHQQVSETGRQAGFIVVDLYDVMSQYNARSLMARSGDPHPSPLGHTLTATALSKKIEHHSLLQCPEP